MTPPPPATRSTSRPTGLVSAAAAFFAGGDLGLLVSGCLALLALVTTGDIIRTGFRAFALPTDPTPETCEDRP